MKDKVIKDFFHDFENLTVSEAVFSDCRKYRYFLKRVWNENKPLITFCMLNPSTADAFKNDPTIERCERRAKEMDYGGIVIVNLFAFRSTNPKVLNKCKNPIGSLNDSFIKKALHDTQRFVCGWGNHGKILNRHKDVLDIIIKNKIEPLCLGQNKDGSPRHPLYVSYEMRLREYI